LHGANLDTAGFLALEAHHRYRDDRLFIVNYRNRGIPGIEILPLVPGTDKFAGSASDAFFRLNHELFSHFLTPSGKEFTRTPLQKGGTRGYPLILSTRQASGFPLAPEGFGAGLSFFLERLYHRGKIFVKEKQYPKNVLFF